MLADEARISAGGRARRAPPGCATRPWWRSSPSCPCGGAPSPACASGSRSFVTDDRITIALSGDLTKTRVPWEADVPPQSAPFLRAYLAEARPVLADRGAGDDPSLWLDRSGKGMSENYIGRASARRPCG